MAAHLRARTSVRRGRGHSFFRPHVSGISGATSPPPRARCDRASYRCDVLRLVARVGGRLYLGSRAQPWPEFTGLRTLCFACGRLMILCECGCAGILWQVPVAPPQSPTQWILLSVFACDQKEHVQRDRSAAGTGSLRSCLRPSSTNAINCDSSKSLDRQRYRHRTVVVAVVVLDLPNYFPGRHGGCSRPRGLAAAYCGH